MKIIQFLLAILLLFIGSIFSYEKVEPNNYPLIEEPIIKEKIIEDNITSEVIDEKENITLTENIESTKGEKTTTTNNTTKKKSKTKTNNKKTQNKTDNKQEESKNKKNQEIKKDPVKEEKPKKETKSEKQKEETKPQCSDFYESITHGKVDKSSKSACVSYGNKIQNAELDKVLDYNEEYGNIKKPTISYFRCYEVVDSNCNTKGWYLHLFCNSGGCDDNKLKSLYG